MTHVAALLSLAWLLWAYWQGLFIWQVKAVWAEFARQMPRLYAQLGQIEAALGTADEQAVLAQAWAEVTKQTIDYGIMEHARDVAVISVCIGWNDVGSWDTLMDLLETDERGNVTMGDHVLVDTQGTLIYSPRKLVAAIGLADLVIVETEDALLICPCARAQDVREVVRTLREKGRKELL